MKLDTNFVSQLRSFIAQGNGLVYRATWIECPQMALYVRLGHRNLVNTVPRSYHRTLEIANIHVREPYQGIGLYAELLSIVDEYLPSLSLYVENVHEIDHHKIYLSRGYEKVIGPTSLDDATSFFKLSTSI